MTGLGKALSLVEITPLHMSDRAQNSLVSGRDYPSGGE